MKPLEAYLESHREAFEQELCQWLRIPSVSTLTSHRDQTRQAAQWLGEQFTRLGLHTEILETKGHPIVYAESPPIAGAPTVLVYGHYDVQPPGPESEWKSPAFEPTRRDGNVYARGATDDKGQVFTHVKSAEAWIKSMGELPCQLKFLIEGEEEIGSHNLYEFLPANREKLKCDVVVVSDTSQFGPGQPAITYGLRGIACFELRIMGPNRDLHSGVFGGGVMNPAIAMSKMLAAMIDDQGKIKIPGFYDDVAPLEEREREQFAALRFSDEGLMKNLGVPALHGEAGCSTLERRWARPTFDINGLISGYQEEGSKTVLPSKAIAKFSFRLVPNQDPPKIAQALRDYLTKICPKGVTMELIDMHGTSAAIVSLDSPFIMAATRAIASGFGKEPVFIREGGSIPIVNAFRKELGVDTLLLGWGLDDDNPHGPNEKFNLGDFHRAIRSSAWLWEELSKIPKAT